MATRDFRNLNVWQLAMDFAENVYDITKQLPQSETYALADQLRRAVVSIPSNIAEGQKRLNRRETVQFTGIALGSLAEAQTQLMLVQRVYNISTEQLINDGDIIGRMLTSHIKKLRV